jgi:hypothetical protein
MPPRVLLKNFDTHFRKSGALLERFFLRLDLETGTPKVWTKDQLADLRLLADSLTTLGDAVSEIAARVRDD